MIESKAAFCVSMRAFLYDDCLDPNNSPWIVLIGRTAASPDVNGYTYSSHSGDDE